ncbi:hypothetical protein KEF85_06660 [Methylomonas paludis]|uniref:PEP-CTERM protein-sorting domain-containing protein n=1 Tax=Methylomonas paludis TaxID=1173101 RepID=A0A975RB92_9GAMM|nr:hypothetical protein [Methylomonas paludis]QWF72124.1 hypothetical protein KEF85_06660 [Methylomonas paludis]
MKPMQPLNACIKAVIVIATSFYSMPLLASVTIQANGFGTGITINSNDAGSLYICNGCNPDPVRQYLLTSGYIQAVVEFPTATIPDVFGKAYLSIYPVAYPLWGPVVDVYGFTGNDPAISMSDANAGTFLGSWTLPADFGGPNGSFDVSSFIAGIDLSNNAYVGFDLITPSGGTDVFGLNMSTLTVSSAVPELDNIWLFSAGILGFLALSQRKTVS